MKVLLLAGGESSEREVSLTSGKAVFEALDRLGHQVLALDPATGLSLTGPGGGFLPAPEAQIDRSKLDGRVLTSALESPDAAATEVVFIALHGGAGENGTIQNLLDLAGMRYTGSGMRASAIAIDKAVTKRLAESVAIPTPAWRLYRVGRNGRGVDKALQDAAERFRFPCIVKPNDGGSTIGLTKVAENGGLRPAFEAALAESTAVLVETYVAGREITCAVLSGRALPLVEIVPRNGLYDYEAKYTKGMSEYIVPAQLPESQAHSIQEAALKVYDMVGAAGLTRVDFILDESGAYFFLEINTVPGLTALSLAPMAAQAVGISFDQMIEQLIREAAAEEGGRHG